MHTSSIDHAGMVCWLLTHSVLALEAKGPVTLGPVTLGPVTLGVIQPETQALDGVGIKAAIGNRGGQTIVI